MNNTNQINKEISELENELMLLRQKLKGMRSSSRAYKDVLLTNNQSKIDKLLEKLEEVENKLSYLKSLTK